MIFCNGYYLGSVLEIFWNGAGIILAYGGREIEWYPAGREYDFVCPD